MNEKIESDSSYQDNNSFANDVAKVAIGTIIAQALAILFTPIMTRLYGPDAYGLFTIFTSITAIPIIIASLRYEIAIMLPKRNEDAANILAICLLLVSLTSLLTIFIILLGKSVIIELLNSSSLEPYLWLVPISVLINGYLASLSVWNSRTRRFGRLSIARVTGSITAIAIQILAAYLGYVSGGSLIVSAICGSLLSATIISILIWREFGQVFKESVRLNNMLVSARRYKKFPIFDSGAALSNTISGQLPSYILSAFFSATVVGYYSLGMMVLLLPMNLIGGSIFQVLFQRGSRAKLDGSLALLVEDIMIRLIVIGFFPSFLLMLTGKEFFTVIFGARWAEAGVYAQILAPYVYLNFLASPISFLFSSLELQEKSLFFNIFQIFARFGVLALGGFMGDARLAIILFSIICIISMGGVLLWLLSKAGSSYSKLLYKFIECFIYNVPFLIIILAIKYYYSSMPELIIVIGCLMALPYYLRVIQKDDVMKSYIKYLLNILSCSLSENIRPMKK